MPSTDTSRLAIDAHCPKLICLWQAQLHMQLLRNSSPFVPQFHRGTDLFRTSIRLQRKIDPSPSRSRNIDRDFLPRRHPLTRQPFPRYSVSSSESSNTIIHRTINGMVCCAGIQKSDASPSSPETSPAVQLPRLWSW